MQRICIVLFLFVVGCDSVSQKSIVKVNFDDGSSCTGFFVTDKLIATSSHCNTDRDITLEYWEGTRIKSADGKVETQGNGLEQYTFIKSSVEGPPVEFCEAPIGAPIKLWGWTGEKPQSEKGLILIHWSDKYITSADSKPGWSGGPVDYNGCVIGMNHGRTSAGTSYIKQY